MFDKWKQEAALAAFDGATADELAAALEFAGAERRARLALALTSELVKSDSGVHALGGAFERLLADADAVGPHLVAALVQLALNARAHGEAASIELAEALDYAKRTISAVHRKVPRWTSAEHVGARVLEEAELAAAAESSSSRDETARAVGRLEAHARDLWHLALQSTHAHERGEVPLGAQWLEAAKAIIQRGEPTLELHLAEPEPWPASSDARALGRHVSEASALPEGSAGPFAAGALTDTVFRRGIQPPAPADAGERARRVGGESGPGEEGSGDAAR